ncbi:FAD/NAD(P)-binding oxidoreductase [Streptomyces sp. NPDC047049]|uniref:NAD(P)/FAD-dependent oxidoreductase n=1 Tax=Streptomyces sp. NPDC047049 TaxID=3156688 RepID=UPI0033EA9181
MNTPAVPPPEHLQHIAVVGAGAAGLTGVETLRREGFTGRLTLLGDEPSPPYDRPPLSKQVLAGTWDFPQTLLRTADHYAGLDVELRTGCRATGLDLKGRRLHLDRGGQLAFDGLLIATGVAPRRLPFADGLDGVHVLRGEHDAAALRDHLRQEPRVVVIGAGFLGLEAAAVVRDLGLNVSVVDPQQTPMERQLGRQTGALVAELHRTRGVRMHTGRGVTGLVSNGGRVTGVRTSDGDVLDADCVLVAIGATPQVEWLRSSTVPLMDGVACDAYCQAAPGIFAAGDVASWPSTRYGRRMRLEHRMNATEQGMAAARNLLHGNVDAYDPLPYFWTDQYEAKIQVYGLIPAGAEMTVVEGDLAEGAFVALFHAAGRPVAVLGWNSPKHLRRYRQQLLETPSFERSETGA